MDLSILSECNVDTSLIETLVPPNGSGYNHQKSCGDVGRTMKKNFPDNFALGIIDKDKKELDYLKEFNVVINSGFLTLHKHKTKTQYMIQIAPAMERFILNSAQSVNIDLADYDLPSDLKLLIKESKTLQTKEDPRFRNLFKAVKKAGASDFVRLSGWVEHLKNNPYSVDLNYLRSI